MPHRLPLATIPMLATRVADPGALPAATRQTDEVFEYIVIMTGNGRA